MSVTKLLVLSTVYTLLAPTMGLSSSKTATIPTKKTHQDLISSEASCFEITAGGQVLGSVLEIKKDSNGIKSNFSYTQTFESYSNSKNFDLKVKSSFLQKSESDKNYIPLNASFIVFNGKALESTRLSTFKTKGQSIEVTTELISSNKKNYKPEIEVADEGLVLNAHMLDLLFHQKSIAEIKPKQRMVFKSFKESSGKVVQVNTVLEGQTDYLLLTHTTEGETYSTKHSSKGEMLEGIYQTGNIKFLKCKPNSVKKYLNAAISNEKFKSLFSLSDREKIEKCCQHF